LKTREFIFASKQGRRKKGDFNPSSAPQAMQIWLDAENGWAQSRRMSMDEKRFSPSRAMSEK
jgi:hypothetical protein